MNNILPFTLILALVVSVLSIGSLEIMIAQRQVAAYRTVVGDLPTADTYVQTQLQDAQKSTPEGTAITNPFGSPYTLSDGTKVSAALEGQTTTGSYSADNVDNNSESSERRIAVDLTLTGLHGVAVEQRTLWRVTDTLNGPVATILGEQRLGGGLTSSTVVAADVGGCSASTKTGCDPNAVSTPDSSVFQGYNECAQGVGSGSCIGQTWSTSTYTNQNLSNAQAAQGSAP